MNNQINDKEMFVQKRSGELVEFSKEKLFRSAVWFCDSRYTHVDDIDLNILPPIRQEMAKELYEALVRDYETSQKHGQVYQTSDFVTRAREFSANKVSLINPEWQNVAAKAYLLEIYRDRWPNVQFQKGEYPHIKQVWSTDETETLNRMLSEMDDETIKKLQNLLEPERDNFFVFAALYYMMSKYCLSRELPQHTFLRAAIFLFWDSENIEDSLANIADLYEALSCFRITLATPILRNAGTRNPQTSSCILTQADDSAEGLLENLRIAGIYSKFKGGIAIDYSKIRSAGDPIKGTGGRSGGIVPFIKAVDSVVSAFDQGGLRKGAAVVTLPFWHPEIIPFLELKLETTPDERSARNLKYCLKLNKYFIQAVEADEDIHLFSPYDYPKLAETWGEEWEKEYKRAIQENPNGKKIKAREIAYHFLKARVETGNVYAFFDDNANERNQQNHLSRHIGYINATNLCTEIMQPSRPGPEGITLCTLGSVNCRWYSTEWSECEKRKTINILYHALRNSIERQFYPFPETAKTAKENMFLGIGVFNYAFMLATHGLKFSDPKSIEFAGKIIKDIRAKLDQVNQKQSKPSKLLMAIAPTASSSRITGGTESVNPIRSGFIRFDATINLPFVVPEWKEYNKYYELAMDIDPYVLLDHAAERQKYIDQGQSTDIWIDSDTAYSFRRLWDIHSYAHRKGLKSLYYLHTLKEDLDEICESCM